MIYQKANQEHEDYASQPGTQSRMPETEATTSLGNRSAGTVSMSVPKICTPNPAMAIIATAMMLLCTMNTRSVGQGLQPVICIPDCI